MKTISHLFQKYYARLAILLLWNTIFISSCTTPENNYVKTEADKQEKAKDVSEVKVTLPKGEGLELVETNCVPCHSLRYIEMQPDMTKKSWEKIVTKMIKSFGAPIKDTIVSNQIVEYLVAIKGKK